MNRITRHQMFMQIAHVVAQRSDCSRLNVGAVLVKNNRIVSIGYNGSPSGKPHCEDRHCAQMAGACDVVHAEKNAILHCPVKVSGLTIYVTHSPCRQCADMLAERRIAELFYGVPYRDTNPLELLRHSYIDCSQVLPNGIVLPWVGSEIQTAPAVASHR